MIVQIEAPQLFEGEEGLGEAPQPPTASGMQHQLLEAPRELPQGLDIGPERVGAGALDDEGAQPAEGDDIGPQGLPERPVGQPAEVRTDENVGQRRPNDGDEPAQVLRAEVFESFEAG